MLSPLCNPGQSSSLGNQGDEMRCEGLVLLIPLTSWREPCRSAHPPVSLWVSGVPREGVCVPFDPLGQFSDKHALARGSEAGTSCCSSVID